MIQHCIPVKGHTNDEAIHAHTTSAWPSGHVPADQQLANHTVKSAHVGGSWVLMLQQPSGEGHRCAGSTRRSEQAHGMYDVWLQKAAPARPAGQHDAGQPSPSGSTVTEAEEAAEKGPAAVDSIGGSWTQPHSQAGNASISCTQSR